MPVCTVYIVACGLAVQEYSPAGQANQVSSLMWLIDMQMDDAITKEDAADNRHLRTWLIVSSCAAHTFENTEFLQLELFA